MPQSQDDRRRHIRYNPDKNTVMSISPNTASGNEDELIGLLRDTSKGGCAGIFHQDYFEFSVGDEIRLFTDELEQKDASIVWIKKLDKMFVKVGFEYFEVTNDSGN